jgi:hypothetical protein
MAAPIRTRIERLERYVEPGRYGLAGLADLTPAQRRALGATLSDLIAGRITEADALTQVPGILAAT